MTDLQTMEAALIAHARVHQSLDRSSLIKHIALIERIAEAATTWVYDQECSAALADLENAVVALTGIPIGWGRDEAGC